MKTTLLILCVFLGLISSHDAAPLGTGFTYQGRLDDGASPANGLYDFNFKLYDADTGGTLLGPGAGVSTNAVAVTGGVFTVYLDFGSVFTGNARWLDISVNTNAALPLNPMTPRQPVFPTPYALFAKDAGSAASVAANGVNNASLADNSVTGAKIVNGSVVRSLNGLTDAVNLIAGANVTLTPSGGGNLTISASGSSGSPWLLNGNGGTASTNFLGTTDNQPLNIRVNNQRAWRLEPTATAPNTIGGAQSNLVSAGSVGAVIGGGGYGVGGPGAIDDRNQVSDNYGTISGGARNVAGNTNGSAADAKYASVGGGYSNQAQGEQSTIAGGRGNRARGLNSVVVGGLVNHAQADSSVVVGGEGNYVGTNIVDAAEFGVNINYAGYSVVLGGELNRISSIYSSIGGGTLNGIFGDYGTIAGGYDNHISESDEFSSGSIVDGAIGGGSYNQVLNSAGVVAGGSGNIVSGGYASILGGENNSVDGTRSSVLGGRNNSIAATNSTILGGEQNTIPSFAPHSIAAGRGATARKEYSTTMGAMFAAPGDGQVAQYVMKTTTSGTINSFLLGPLMPASGAMGFRALITAKAFGDFSAAFEVRGLVRRYGSGTSFVGTPTVTVLGRDHASLTVTPTLPVGSVSFDVHGIDGLDVRWVCHLETSEVVF